MVFPLTNTVQPYAWGSATSIPELFGIENPDGTPMAEIWMGAHPKAPSMLEVNGKAESLAAYIERDPAGCLGEAVAGRFDGRLPFLFKILAAAEPLSIQAHPSLEQARAGFERENARGPALDAPERNYRDANHKPELIYALTTFWGLRGFRSPDAITRDLARAVDKTGIELALPVSDADLSGFFASLMRSDRAKLATLIDEVVRTAGERWPDARSEPEAADPGAHDYWVQQLAERYPADPGVLAPLFLNLFALQPGEATYQPAGVLHAYLRGTGAELMANSDNVLRGGLTVKHVDLEELLAVGVFRTEPEAVVGGLRVFGAGPAGTACSEVEYAAPFEEFRFSRVEVAGECPLTSGAPQILFCSDGAIAVRAGNGSAKEGRDDSGEKSLRLRAGESVFVRADEGELLATGSGQLLRATTGGRFAPVGTG